MLYCFKDDLEIAIAIIDCSADFYGATKRIVFVSLIYGLLLFVCVLVAFWGECMLYAQGDPKFT